MWKFRVKSSALSGNYRIYLFKITRKNLFDDCLCITSVTDTTYHSPGMSTLCLFRGVVKIVNLLFLDDISWWLSLHWNIRCNKPVCPAGVGTELRSPCRSERMLLWTSVSVRRFCHHFRHAVIFCSGGRKGTSWARWYSPWKRKIPAPSPWTWMGSRSLRMSFVCQNRSLDIVLHFLLLVSFELLITKPLALLYNNFL